MIFAPIWTSADVWLALKRLISTHSLTLVGGASTSMILVVVLVVESRRRPVLVEEFPYRPIISWAAGITTMIVYVALHRAARSWVFLNSIVVVVVVIYLVCGRSNIFIIVHSSWSLLSGKRGRVVVVPLHGLVELMLVAVFQESTRHRLVSLVATLLMARRWVTISGHRR